MSHVDGANHVVWQTTHRGETHAEFRVADAEVDLFYWPQMQRNRYSADGQKVRMLCGYVDLGGSANAWNGTDKRCSHCMAKLSDAVALATRLITEHGARKKRIQDLQNPAFDLRRIDWP